MSVDTGQIKTKLFAAPLCTNYPGTIVIRKKYHKEMHITTGNQAYVK